MGLFDKLTDSKPETQEPAGSAPSTSPGPQTGSESSSER